MALYARRESGVAQVVDTLLHAVAHLEYVGARRSGNEYAQSLLAIVEKFVAHRSLIALLHPGNVAQAQAVVVVSLYYHLRNLLHAGKLVAHGHADAVVAVVEVA